MSDPTSALPVAGWYTDPSDGASERWWGGLEWTDHIRPLDVAPPVAAAPRFPPPTSPAPALQPPPPASAFAAASAFGSPSAAGQPAMAASAGIPQFASQTGGEIPQFASQTAGEIPQFASQTAGEIPQFASQQPVAAAVPAAPFSPTQYTTIEEAAAAFGAAAAAPAATGPISTGWPAAPATGSPWDTPATATGSPWDTPAASADPYASFGAQPDAGAAPAWNSSPPSYGTGAPGEQPGNTIATVGFVLSLLGFGLISLILSILGLRKSRELAQNGLTAVGGTLSKWGIGLSIWTMVVGIVAAGIFGYSSYLVASSGMLDHTGSGTGTTTIVETPAATDPTTTVDAAVPGANPVADEISADMAGDMDFMFDSEAQSVTCPADAAETAGSVVTCNIVLVDGRTGSGTRTFDADGGSSTTYAMQ